MSWPCGPCWAAAGSTDPISNGTTIVIFLTARSFYRQAERGRAAMQERISERRRRRSN
jgi:hypothetical protein